MRLVVERGRVGDPDDRTLDRKESCDRLPPRLLSRRVQKGEPFGSQLFGCRVHGGRALDFELEADLGNRPVSWPFPRAETGLRSLGERPDTEVVAARDLPARVVPVLPLALEREAEGVDIELSACWRVGGHDGDACNELDPHLRSPPAGSRVVPTTRFAVGSGTPVSVATTGLLREQAPSGLCDTLAWKHGR